ncbi:MAG: hypothetical protein R3E01_30900 [Pirellulaceae bacterium]
MANASGANDSNTVDVLSIQFPTDEFSVRKLIDAFPGEFQWSPDPHTGTVPDNYQPDLHSEPFSDLRWAMLLERELADMSFRSRQDPGDDRQQSRMNFPTLDGKNSRADDIRSLDDYYRALGISTGLKQTIELVRRFEAQAAKQAARGPSI